MFRYGHWLRLRCLRATTESWSRSKVIRSSEHLGAGPLRLESGQRKSHRPVSLDSRQARLSTSRLLPAGLQILPRSCPSLLEHYEQSPALGLARPLLNSQLTRSTVLTRQFRSPARKTKGPPACNCQDERCDPLFYFSTSARCTPGRPGDDLVDLPNQPGPVLLTPFL
jgi:hypothetical protein